MRQVNYITGQATRDEVLKRYPGAADAVPLDPPSASHGSGPSQEDDDPHIIEGSL